MTTQHTPGKWYVEQSGTSPAYIIADGAGVHATIAEVIGRWHLSPEIKANARLIAAAPETATERDQLRASNAELVAALEHVEQYAQRQCDLDEVDAILWAQLVSLARAAIAATRRDGT